MINDYEATEPIVPTTEQSTAAESNSEIISTLNGLLEICKDGEEGFRTAADGVTSLDLKSDFNEISNQRAEFSGVLQQLVRSLGGDPAEGGSVSGALHRGWMDLKSAITGKSDEAILNECERGEDYAKEAYQEALKTNLPANLADVVSQQSQTILATHNRIKSMRNAESKSAASSQ